MQVLADQSKRTLYSVTKGETLHDCTALYSITQAWALYDCIAYVLNIKLIKLILLIRLLLAANFSCQDILRWI
jgi:hypothetical protein